MSGPFDDGEVEVSWSDSVFHRSGRIENRNADYDRSFQQLGTLECPVSIIVSCSQSPDDLRGLSHIDVISELWVDIRKNEPDAPYTVTDQLDGVTVHKIWFAGDFRSSLPGLTRVKDLHTLELSQRGHLDYDSDSFSPLQHLSDLQYLDLFIDDLSSARIPLGGLSSLKGLRINAKALSSRSLLLDGATSIESMHLCSRELQACFRSLGKAVGLKELSLQLGRLNHTGIAAINSLPHLEHLKLHDCLTPAQLTQITNPSLLTISAELSGDSRSPLTTERLLAWDYPANASLDISNCDVWTPRGLQHFVKDLPDMTQEERALYRACESTRAIISEHETRIRNFRVFQEERGLDYSDRYLASALKECEDLCRKVLNATSNLYTLRRIQLNNALAIQNGFYRYCGGRIILEEELTARQTAGLQKDRRNWRRYVDTQRNSWQ